MTDDSWNDEKCRKMGFSNSITLTFKYQNHFKFLEDVQLRFLSLFLEFERLTVFCGVFVVSFGSNGLIAVGVWKSAGKWDFQIP